MLNITIIGMGLIGTSVGMALRNANAKDAPLGPISVTGFDQSSRALADARGRLAIDRQVRTLEEALADAQIIIIAVPVQAVREVFSAVASYAAHGAIVTDVGSTKAQIVEWAKELLPTSVDFIGGHPMAGKERSGASAAEPTLFKDAIYCLTPTARTRPETIEVIDALVRQLGAKPYYIEAIEHDHYVAGVSHLPFLLSTLLVDVTHRSAGWKEMAPLAATGYRDMSRLASGDPEMHRDICITNRDALLRWLDDTAKALQDVRTQLADADDDALLEFFTRAQNDREAWLNTRPNLRPGEDDFESMTQVTVERPNMFGRMFGNPTRGKKK